MARALRRSLIATAAVALPASVLAVVSLSANAATGFPAHYAAPYLQINTSDSGDMAADRSASGLKYYTLAFLIPKSGCTPQWEDGNESLGAFTSQVNAVKSAGGNVIISFGGAEGGELAQTCTSVSSLTAAYRNVVDTYGITRLDFDIEGGTLDDTTANSRRNQALAALQASNPAVEVDYTLATDPGGMPAKELNVVKDAKSKGVKVNLVNIMTMDFGDGENVLNDAESAANGLHSQLGSVYTNLSSAQLWNMEGLTTIAGKNDDNENFTQSQANSLESFAAARGIQELAFWEVDGYDKPLGYAYSKIFNKITGGTGPTPSPTPTPTPTPTGGGGTGTTFVGAGSGKCIDDPKSSTTNGTQMEIWTCNGGANQSIAATGGTLRVIGKCFDAPKGATANGTIIEIWSCNGGANQQFSYNSSNGTIVGSQSGKCVTVQSAATTNGAGLILYTCNGGSNQKWTRK
jgi:Ricin-type beta-trefoil lectin domain/Glycosyl hydrolases family 18